MAAVGLPIPRVVGEKAPEGTGKKRPRPQSQANGPYYRPNEEAQFLIHQLFQEIDCRLRVVEGYVPPRSMSVQTPHDHPEVPETSSTTSTTTSGSGSITSRQRSIKGIDLVAPPSCMSGPPSLSPKSNNGSRKKKAKFKKKASLAVMDQYGVPVRDLCWYAGRDKVTGHKRQDPPLVYNEKQDPDEVEMEVWLSKHRHRINQVRSAIRLQAFYRMYRARKRFLKHKERLWAVRALFLRAWKLSHLADRYRTHHLYNMCFQELKAYTDEQKRIRQVSMKVFQKSAMDGTLSMSVIHLFFSAWQGKNPRRGPIEDTWMCGVMRNILKVIMKGWALEVRRLKTNRLEASLHLIKAWRLGASHQGQWLIEVVFLLFHMWRRMIRFRKALEAGTKPLPVFEDPKLREWEQWVFSHTRQRVLWVKLQLLGAKMMKRWMMVRWKAFLKVKEREIRRYQFAEDHYQLALRRRVLRAWTRCARERGRLLRGRIKYLLAWHEWAPRHRRTKWAKHIVMERARIRRLTILLRDWQRHITVRHQLRAFRIDRLTDRYNSSKLLTVAFLVSNKQRPAQFMAIKCWREWRAIAVRSRRWRNFKFLHRKMFSGHLQRVVLRAWRMVSGKKSKDVERLTLEPVAAMERYLGLEIKMDQGFQPEALLTTGEMTRLLCPTIHQHQETPHHHATRKPCPSPDVDSLCEAIGEEDHARVRTLLAQGVNVNGVKTDGTLTTPLHVAAMTLSLGGLRLVAQLLSCGAQVTCRNKDGDLPLDLAVDPRVAALLHQHQQRLAACGFTIDEKKRSVDVLNELWSDLHTQSLWKYVTYALVRQRLLYVRQQVLSLKVEPQHFSREWTQYKSLKATTASNSTATSTDGESVLLGDLMGDEASTELTPPGTNSDRASEGSLKDVAVLPPTMVEARLKDDSDMLLLPELRERLWRLFPILEASEQLSHVLNLLEKCQLLSDRLIVPDGGLLADLGIDLLKGEVVDYHTPWRVQVDPSTSLIVPPSPKQEGLEKADPYLRRKVQLEAIEAREREELRPITGRADLLSRSDVWFTDWCIDNQPLVGAALGVPDVDRDCTTTTTITTAITEETQKMKALLVCLARMAAKEHWVLLERRALNLRDKALLDGQEITQRRSRKMLKALAFQARRPFEGLLPPPEEEAYLRSTDTTTSTAILDTTANKDKQGVQEQATSEPLPLFVPAMAVGVVPYSHKCTQAVSLAMRCSLRSRGVEEAIGYLDSQVPNDFWQQTLLAGTDEEFPSCGPPVLNLLPSTWANSHHVLDKLRASVSAFRGEELGLLNAFYNTNAQLSTMTKTINQAITLEDATAAHVIKQAQYMKSKTQGLRGQLGATIALTARLQDELAAKTESLTTVKEEVAQLTVEMDGLLLQPPGGSPVNSTSGGDNDGGRKVSASIMAKLTPRTKMKTRKLQDRLATKINERQEVKARIEGLLSGLETARTKRTQLEVDLEAATLQMKKLIKESLLFMQQATIMKRTYQADRRKLVATANSLLQRMRIIKDKTRHARSTIKEVERAQRRLSTLQNGEESDGTQVEASDLESLDDLSAPSTIILYEEIDADSTSKKSKKKKKGKGKKSKDEQERTELDEVEESLLLEQQGLSLGAFDGDDSSQSSGGSQLLTNGLPPAIVLPSGRASGPSSDLTPSNTDRSVVDMTVEELRTLYTPSRKATDPPQKSPSRRSPTRVHLEPKSPSSLGLADKGVAVERSAKEGGDTVGGEFRMGEGNAEDIIQEPPVATTVEQLYDKALLRLFKPERREAALLMAEKLLGKDLDTVDEDEAAEAEAQAQAELVATWGGATDGLRMSSSGSDEELGADGKRSGVFARVWERVRRQNLLLVGTTDFVRDDGVANNAHEEEFAESRCSTYRFANIGPYPKVIMDMSEVDDLDSYDEENYEGRGVEMAANVQAVMVEGEKMEVAWEADDPARPASVSAKAQPDTILGAQEILTITQRPPEMTLTESLRSQRRVVRNMDSRELKGLVIAADASGDNFIVVSLSYRDSFDGLDDSVFRLQEQPSAIISSDSRSTSQSLDSSDDTSSSVKPISPPRTPSTARSIHKPLRPVRASAVQSPGTSTHKAMALLSADCSLVLPSPNQSPLPRTPKQPSPAIFSPIIMEALSLDGINLSTTPTDLTSQADPNVTIITTTNAPASTAIMREVDLFHSQTALQTKVHLQLPTPALTQSLPSLPEREEADDINAKPPGLHPQETVDDGLLHDFWMDENENEPQNITTLERPTVYYPIVNGYEGVAGNITKKPPRPTPLLCIGVGTGGSSAGKMASSQGSATKRPLNVEQPDGRYIRRGKLITSHHLLQARGDSTTSRHRTAYYSVRCKRPMTGGSATTGKRFVGIWGLGPSNERTEQGRAPPVLVVEAEPLQSQVLRKGKDISLQELMDRAKANEPKPAVLWSLKEESICLDDVDPSHEGGRRTAIEEASEGRFRRAKDRMPHLELEGLGYEVPPTAPSLHQLSTLGTVSSDLTCSEDMPMLSTDAKKRVWQDFQHHDLEGQSYDSLNSFELTDRAYQILNGPPPKRLQVDQLLARLEDVDEAPELLLAELLKSLPSESRFSTMLGSIDLSESMEDGAEEEVGWDTVGADSDSQQVDLRHGGDREECVLETTWSTNSNGIDDNDGEGEGFHTEESDAYARGSTMMASSAPASLVGAQGEMGVSVESSRAATAASRMSAEIRMTLAMRDMLRAMEMGEHNTPETPSSNQQQRLVMETPPEEQEQQRRDQERSLADNVVLPYKSRREAFEESRARQRERERAGDHLMLQQSWSYEAIWKDYSEQPCLPSEERTYYHSTNPRAPSAPSVPLHHTFPRTRQASRRAESQGGKPSTNRTGTGAPLSSWGEGDDPLSVGKARDAEEPQTEEEGTSLNQPQRSGGQPRGANKAHKWQSSLQDGEKRGQGTSTTPTTADINRALTSHAHASAPQSLSKHQTGSRVTAKGPGANGKQTAAAVGPSALTRPDRGIVVDDRSVASESERSVSSWRIDGPALSPSFQGIPPSSFDTRRSPSPGTELEVEGGKVLATNYYMEEGSHGSASATLEALASNEPFSLFGTQCPQASPTPLFPPINVPVIPKAPVKPGPGSEAGSSMVSRTSVLVPDFLLKTRSATQVKASPKGFLAAHKPRRAEEPIIKVFGDRFWQDSTTTTKSAQQQQQQQQQQKKKKRDSGAGAAAQEDDQPPWSRYTKRDMDTTEIDRRDGALFSQYSDGYGEGRAPGGALMESWGTRGGPSQTPQVSLLSVADDIRKQYESLRLEGLDQFPSSNSSLVLPQLNTKEESDT